MNQHMDSGAFDIGSPARGTVISLTAVGDPAFSSGALGPGAAVLPMDGTITAPVSGTLTVAMPHAYGIQTAGGEEVLVHVGIGTVNLSGEHFRTRVEKGQRVELGDVLCTVELDVLAAKGIDSTVIVVVPNMANAQAVIPIPRELANPGEPLITVVT